MKSKFFLTGTLLAMPTTLLTVACGNDSSNISEARKTLEKINTTSLTRFDFKNVEITYNDLDKETATKLGFELPKLSKSVNVKVIKELGSETVSYKIISGDKAETLRVAFKNFKYWLSPSELSLKILNTFRLQMAKNGPELISENSSPSGDPVLSEKAFQNLKDYTSNISLDPATVEIKLNDELTYSFNLSGVKAWVDKIKTLLQNEYSYFGTKLDPSPTIIGTYELPEISATTAYMLGLNTASKMQPFLDIAERKDYGQTDDEKRTAILSTHPYINMLKEYHKLIWTFVQSNEYKEWIKGQDFTLYSFTNNKLQYKTVKPGEYWDSRKFIDDINNNNNWVSKPESITEFSNFEALFGATIINVEDLITVK